VTDEEINAAIDVMRQRARRIEDSQQHSLWDLIKDCEALLSRDGEALANRTAIEAAVEHELKIG
jgi:hypothetical protein